MDIWPTRVYGLLGYIVYYILHIIYYCNIYYNNTTFILFQGTSNTKIKDILSSNIYLVKLLISSRVILSSWYKNTISNVIQKTNAKSRFKLMMLMCYI